MLRLCLLGVASHVAERTRTVCRQVNSRDSTSGHPAARSIKKKVPRVVNYEEKEKEKMLDFERKAETNC